MHLIQLDPHDPQQAFPPIQYALQEPNGLLAFGGCLSPQRIINAYKSGVFPWYNPGEPILWWSPNPRLVLLPTQLKVSRSLEKTLRKHLFTIRYDNDFISVINACAEPRAYSTDTWISEDMQQAYSKLHSEGVAHSFEAWADGELVGGLYGLAIGRVFFGESMFHRQTDASKVVFVHLVRQLHIWGYQMIDCQVSSAHLQSFGATEISRDMFQALLSRYCQLPPNAKAWKR
jgi:leucyl/phenylalanyl-tRNA---protein transferase